MSKYSPRIVLEQDFLFFLSKLIKLDLYFLLKKYCTISELFFMEKVRTLFGGFNTMALKDTIKKMDEMLAELTTDLRKASEKGNKAASQRVRTGTIKFAKLAKLYRKESIAAGCAEGKKQKAKKSSRKPASKKAAPKPAAKRKKSASKRKGR